MRKIKIVADSSADTLQIKNIPFAVAPLKIVANKTEFVDDAALDVRSMVSWFDAYKGKSQTSCPNPSDWLNAFEDYDEVFCVTITSGLSGSYNSACIAKQMYESENAGKQVYVVNSLSAGPELALIIEKLEEYIGQEMPFEEICQAIEDYKATTGLAFMLESLRNLAANGRVSPAVAKIAGVLGIRVVGKASLQGTLEPLSKCRGEAKALLAIVNHLKEEGFAEGKMRIAHCQNEAAAQELSSKITALFPKAQVQVYACRGLCSYYAEKGGLLVGFEKI